MASRLLASPIGAGLFAYLLLATSCSTPPEPAPPPPPPPAEAPVSEVPPAPPPKRAQPTEPWMRMRNPPTSADQVCAARDLVPAITWPESIEEPTRILMQAVASNLDVHGGIRHIRAKNKLRESGYPATFAVLEVLRELDYLDAEQAAFGYELNQLMSDLTGGLNARYAAIRLDEQIPPAKAEWNARTVKAWASVLAQWPDEDAFESARQARRRR